jgi:hypothetical protein
MNEFKKNIFKKATVDDAPPPTVPTISLLAAQEVVKYL